MKEKKLYKTQLACNSILVRTDPLCTKSRPPIIGMQNEKNSEHSTGTQEFGSSFDPLREMKIKELSNEVLH
jgi:hypothetical protein